MAGDIIGCLIDMDSGTISYSRLVSVLFIGRLRVIHMAMSCSRRRKVINWERSEVISARLNVMITVSGNKQCC